MVARRANKRASRGSAAEKSPATTKEDIDLRGLEDAIGHHLRLAYQMQVQRFASVGAPFNIRPSQFAMLKLMYFNPDLKQMHLTKALVKKHANIVTALDELERRNLVSRIPDPNDKRSRVLRLTPHGQELVQKLLARHARLTKDLEQHLGTRKLSQLVALLQKFRNLDPEPNIDEAG